MDFKLTKGQYKSFAELEWTNIPSLSVVIGKNGSGKTQLLELISYHFTQPNKKRNQKPEFPFYKVETECNGIEFDYHDAVYIPNVWQISNMGAINSTSYNDPIDKVYDHVVKNVHNEEYSELAAIIEASIGKPKENISREDIQQNLPIDYINYVSKVIVNEGLNNIYQMYHLKRAELRDQNKTDGEIEKEMGPAPWDVLNSMLKKAKFPYYTTKPISYIGNFELKLVSTKDKNLIINFSDLSSGEKVLISLTIWMYNSNFEGRLPKLILMDEPDAHLHPSLTKQFLDVIHKIIVDEYNVRVIFTTHSPSTISMLPIDNLFEITTGNPRIKKLKSIGYGIDLLTEGIITIRSNTKYILVEDKNDALFYSEVFKILQSKKKIKDNVGGLFIPSSNKSAGVTGGCTVVRKWVEKFVSDGIDNIFQGLMDRDNGTNDPETITPIDNLHVVNRYSLENYLLDPILIYSSILHDNRLITIPGISLSHRDEHKISKLASKKLQVIADHILNLVEPSVNGLTQDDKILKEVSYINRRKIKYPMWFLNKRGHTLYGLFKLRYRTAVDYNKLINAMIRQELIPNEFVGLFNRIQSI